MPKFDVTFKTPEGFYVTSITRSGANAMEAIERAIEDYEEVSTSGREVVGSITAELQE